VVPLLLLAQLGIISCKEVARVHEREPRAAADAGSAREVDAAARTPFPVRGTFGSITDIVTGKPLEVASVRFKSADPGAESEGFVQPDFAVVTVTEPKGYYSYEGDFPQGIVKIQVDAEGYEPLLAYINHLHTEECASGPCTRHDFALWPKGHPHPLLPDLLPNSSYVHPSKVELTKECDGREGVAVCLRAPVGIANMAQGDLFMSAPLTRPKQVTQHIFNSDGTMIDRLLEADFGEDPKHQTILFPDWVRLAMRKIDENCDSRATAEQCPVVRESWRDASCMRDYIVVEPNFESERRYDCVVSEDGVLEQGIGAGQMDVHDIAFIDQFIDVTGLPNGEYWLEAVVNPNQVVHEADYTNNTGRGRFELELPECGDGKIDEPESCEGDDLNGATCESIDDRYAGGKLRCTEHCGFDRSDCTLAVCDPVDLGSALGSVVQGNIMGARNTTSPIECLLPTGTGRDVAFYWTAPEAGPYSMTDRRDALFISVRDESCDGPELACVTEGAWAGLEVNLEKGQRVVIVLDVYPGREGRYDLRINSLQ
jgi:hypothetical protein